jgi:signal transduction histidine kinase
VLRAVEKEYAPVCVERNLTLYIGDTQDVPLIEADGARLRTAIENVVGNAIKYTPDGGHIMVTAQQIVNTDTIDIVIRDTGIGIPTEEQRNIFEQFYVLGEVAHHSSSKSAFGGGGLGIGLSITKGIIDAHHGRVWVESKGRDEVGLPGTAIHLVMPIKQKPRD